MLNIVLFGIQGSGKGTQAGLISKNLDIEHINLGELFRREIKSKSEIGLIAKSFIDKGNFVPDEHVYTMIDGAVAKGAKGVVFDGFPRNEAQADYLINHYHVDFVFYLDLEDRTAKERLMARAVCRECHKNYNLLSNPPRVGNKCDNCGGIVGPRSDDTPEAIDRRIEKFHNKTKSLIDYFEEKGLLYKIDAKQDVNEVNRIILEIIKENGKEISK
jgi:adenylate kinase